MSPTVGRPAARHWHSRTRLPQGAGHPSRARRVIVIAGVHHHGMIMIDWDFETRDESEAVGLGLVTRDFSGTPTARPGAESR